MRRREFAFLALGLFLGLLIGAVVVSGSDELRQLIGTAGGSPPTPLYYQVEFAAARDWVLEARSGSNDAPAVAEAATEIEALPSAANLRQGLRDAEGSIDTFLTHTYTLLAGEQASTETETTRAEQLLACLGLNDDPYQPAPALYLYLQVPPQFTGTLPEWDKLEGTKNNDLYWQLLACQPEPT